MENELEKAKIEVFLKYMDPKNFFISVGKTFVGIVVDTLLSAPVSTAVSLIENFKDIYGVNNKRWQAFIIEAKSKLK